MQFERQKVPFPRTDWREKVNEVGMYYHTVDDQVYWNEDFCYVLDSELVDKIEDATTRLHEMSMNIVADVIKKGDYRGYEYLTDYDKQLIETSWKNNHQDVYGRFDLGIDRNYNIFMLEYNADTPTSLLEASVVQWNWKEEQYSAHDQFNLIHEKLIEWWKRLSYRLNYKNIHFAAMTDAPYEDWGNLHYLMETASLAGIKTYSINLETIGWDSDRNTFVDINNNNIDHLFKLYPWEWIVQEEFSKFIMDSNTVFIEPAWKILLSNKMLCAKMWEYYPNHENLLEAYDPKIGMGSRDVLNKTRICKPKLGREGQGIFLTNNDFPVNHSDGSSIVQEKMNIVQFGDIQPVIGSWIIGGESAGIGIREDIGITTNNSQFVPHIF